LLYIYILLHVSTNACHNQVISANTFKQTPYMVHSPTDAHLLKLLLQFTLKLDGSRMFRSTTIIRELATEPG